MALSLSLPLALVATIVEALIGYPAPLYRAIGHPVTWMGRWLAGLEALANRPALSFAARRAMGVGALLVYLASIGLVAWLATRALLSFGALGFAALVVLAASLPAQRSLGLHVKAVADGLDAGLDEGRSAVAKIVGRNPDPLDGPGVARAAIESLAENFSDGVVAPILWTALGGLVGGALYKAINTADSMIGHKDDRHRAFGWAAARLDDLVNLPASRLAALWLILAAAMTRGASARRRDSRCLERRRAPSLAQRRLARSRNGGRARPQTGRAAHSTAERWSMIPSWETDGARRTRTTSAGRCGFTGGPASSRSRRWRFWPFSRRETPAPDGDDGPARGQDFARFQCLHWDG